MLLRIYQQQVLLHCNYVFMARKQINDGLARRDPEAIFFGVQNLLNAAANIAKALWGERGKMSAQRKELRDSIGVGDDSPLHEVDMRNNFEHFDERLDRWWNESTDHNYVGFVIGPRSAISGMDEKDILRHFDPATTNVIFWSQRFNIQAIITEIERILPKLRTEASKPHWGK